MLLEMIFRSVNPHFALEFSVSIVSKNFHASVESWATQ